jgi:ferredoxin-thioredoxin reductase catalytic subunit
MTVKQNPDKEFVLVIKKKLKENNGYCPCSLEKTPDTKCMCKEFREMLEANCDGSCHCGLYIITKE